MNKIETDILFAEKLAHNIVLVEAKYGVEINKEKSLNSNKILVETMVGDYGMIVDRKLDYSIDPVSIYALLNSIEPLKVIAIVLHKESSLSMIPTEQRLFKGPLEVFWNVEDAQVWMADALHRIGNQD
ncbi:MAG: hypothetical protein OEX19_03100 [Gammaproteobacteria bacterium]|nr:hypothetical protein [Gammaproteobacteria bacterium]